MCVCVCVCLCLSVCLCKCLRSGSRILVPKGEYIGPTGCQVYLLQYISADKRVQYISPTGGSGQFTGPFCRVDVLDPSVGPMYWSLLSGQNTSTFCQAHIINSHVGPIY